MCRAGDFLKCVAIALVVTDQVTSSFKGSDAFEVSTIQRVASALHKYQDQQSLRRCAGDQSNSRGGQIDDVTNILTLANFPRFFSEDKNKNTDAETLQRNTMAVAIITCSVSTATWPWFLIHPYITI